MVNTSLQQIEGIDFDTWQRRWRFAEQWPAAQVERLRQAFHDAAPESIADRKTAPALDAQAPLQAADLLAELGLDIDAVIAALLHSAIDHQRLTLDQVRSRYGDPVAELIRNATDIDDVSVSGRADLSPEQLERLRKMLLAMARDVRVVLLMLALRLCRMRAAGSNGNAQLTVTERRALARETLDVYAPLANRLGIGQIKWELEDLALRDLDPDVYKTIARALDERRTDRERYIQSVVAELKAALSVAGLDAEVSGRAKHIYSIWNKMRRKKLLFEQLFDVRALRIMVPTLADCYTALGVVHSTWKNIPQEFDDYIANPKGNGYQSLHTAVVGPAAKTLEVQIRTRDMHRNAELGIAAHWRYKEGGKQKDRQMEEQIRWFRQMLELNDGVDATDLLDQIDAESTLDRVYVRTPQGDVIDLAAGATPLDFAYHVHTEIGHRCRGARVGGRIVPLHYRLHNGDQVEVLTLKEGTPSRDWLSPHLGYLQTTRARAKVRLWFRLLDRDKNINAGRQALEQDFRRLGVGFKKIDLEALAERFNFAKADDLYAAIGSGDLTTQSVIAKVQDLVLPAKPPPPSPKPRTRIAGQPQIDIRGVGQLLTQIARCCQPVPLEAIVGYVTQGRGVSIHRADCTNALSLRNRYPERFLEVAWGETDGSSAQLFSAEVRLLAYDRPGLLRDISTLLANEHVNVAGLNTHSDPDDSTARMDLRIEIESLEQLSRVLDKLRRLSNVISAVRRDQS